MISLRTTKCVCWWGGTNNIITEQTNMILHLQGLAFPLNHFRRNVKGCWWSYNRPAVSYSLLYRVRQWQRNDEVPGLYLFPPSRCWKLGKSISLSRTCWLFEKPEITCGNFYDSTIGASAQWRQIRDKSDQASCASKQIVLSNAFAK